MTKKVADNLEVKRPNNLARRSQRLPPPRPQSSIPQLPQSRQASKYSKRETLPYDRASDLKIEKF